MTTLGYSIVISIVCGVYLLYLLSHKRYRLIIPSTIHTFTWLLVGVLISLTLSGYVGKTTNQSAADFDLVVVYVLGMVISSIVGFSIAHIVYPFRLIKGNAGIPSKKLNYVLRKYRWILYLCFVIGLILIFYLVSIFGFRSLGDYRMTAVTLKYSGYGALARQLSGHVMILSGFYLAILGYKHGKDSLVFKEFFLCILAFSAPNIAIAGRGWIVSSLLPYFVGYLLAKAQLNKKVKWSEKRNLIILLFSFILLFSLLGVIRSEQNMYSRTDRLNKFLYYTDGSRMMNMVLHQYPPESFQLEYGASEFLGKWIGSPMAEKFNKSIEHDLGLLVTVKSSMPYLYYDFGYTGGIIMWGVFCFIFEVLCAYLQRKSSIICFIIFTEFAKILFQAPIGNIFGMEIPVFEWILIIYIIMRWFIPRKISLSDEKQQM